jgi:hypothetical protein
MRYNPEVQYRCTIIRGKAQTDIEDLLPAYARIIVDACPCDKDQFQEIFDAQIVKVLTSPTAKTIANHRTEISGKLFGMYWEDANGIIHASPRTVRFLESQDTPAFFKEICTKFQFPNGMDKIQTTIDRVKNSVSLRPLAFMIKLMLESDAEGIVLTKNEVAYYVLNSLNVLQGNVPTRFVLQLIKNRRQARVFKRVEYPGKESSYCMQHISEMLNILVLANLIRIERDCDNFLIRVNKRETQMLNLLAEIGEQKPEFDVYAYDLGSVEGKKRMAMDWSIFYAKPVHAAETFSTATDTLVPEVCLSNIGQVPLPGGVNTTELGEEGEMIVFNREKARVKNFNERLVNKVIYFGKQRGLGYDISSIRADRTPQSEHAVYIEVKSTKRVTKPQNPHHDQFDLTRNEWVAAEQHQGNYFIYRVYITNEGIFVHIIKDPIQKKNDGVIYAEPLKYHVEFEASEFETWQQ